MLLPIQCSMGSVVSTQKPVLPVRYKNPAEQSRHRQRQIIGETEIYWGVLLGLTRPQRAESPLRLLPAATTGREKESEEGAEPPFKTLERGGAIGQGTVYSWGKGSSL